MPVLRININGRFYDITCEKNKEKYVLELSKYFDKKVRDLSVKLKNVDHSRLLALTGILLSEELNNIMKDKSKVDNPYGKNYKIEVPITSWSNINLIRVSIQAYNTKEDIRKLVDALHEIRSN